jgi:Endonuclease/Exonuclease/phosphatase family
MSDTTTHLASLRAMTLNLWAQHGTWPARRDALREGLQQLRPDVLMLQEAVVDDAWGSCSSYAAVVRVVAPVMV